MIKIRYTAHTPAAEHIFRRYMEEPAKEIKNIEIFKTTPFMIDVTPKLSFMIRRTIEKALKNPQLKENVLEDMRQRSMNSMREIGLRADDYDIEVITR